MSNIDYEKLYLQYRAYLRKICRRFTGFCEMDDLMQMAYIGLHNAANTFREDGGASFTSYTAVCVKRTILRELESTGAIIRVPTHVHADIRKYKQARQELTHELFRSPLPNELAEKLQISLSDIWRIEKAINLMEISSLDTPIGDDDGYTLTDSVSDTVTENAAERAERQELHRLLWQAAKNCLDDDLFELVFEYFREEITLAAIADKKNDYTKNLYRKIKMALNRLRNNRHIRQLGIDFGYINRFRHVTMAEYKFTRVSSVESEVLKREEYQEKIMFDKGFREWKLDELGLSIGNHDPFSGTMNLKNASKREVSIF